jgi:hypothetical protein
MSKITLVMTADWWQGVAALLQITAVLASCYVIFQTRKERKDSIAPVWGIRDSSVFLEYNSDAKSEVEYYKLYGILVLKNTGFGLARNISCKFTSINGNKPTNITIKTSDIDVFPNEEIKLNLSWDIGKPPIGIITLEYKNRLNDSIQKKIHINAYGDKSEKQYLCDFKDWEVNWYDYYGKIEKVKYFFKKYITRDIDSYNPIKKFNISLSNYYKTEGWVRRTFRGPKNSSRASSRGAIVLVNDVSVIHRSPVQVNIDNFLKCFKSIEIPPNASEMRKHIQNKRFMNLNSKDWEKIIDHWVEQDVIDS